VEVMMMMKRRRLVLGGLTALATGTVARLASAGSVSETAAGSFEVTKSEAEWRRILSPEQYHILREAGTEPAGSSPLNEEHRKGTFTCAGCDLPLFSSETKFESGTGWPSFYAPIDGAIGTSEDRTLFFMVRTEVHCSRCGGHLGHVFEDGPPPTGLRYCMNGLALGFEPAASA
jgi:peptide-methionine (R)-S-oxide reductase